MSDESAPLRSRATRGAAWAGVSTIVLRMGGLVVGIVLARLLTPEQFGVYAVALTVQGILLTVADLGLSADIIRSKEPDRVAPTVATLGLTTGVTLTVIGVSASGLLASALDSPAAAPAIAILSLTLFLGGAGVVPYAMLTRRFQQRELFAVGVADFVVSTVVTLVLVALGFGVMGLAIGRVVAQVVSTSLQFILAKVVPRYSIDRSVLGPVLSFGLPIAAANLLSWTLLNVDNIILARVVGATALGFYVLAFNISSWPMTALSQMVRAISLPYFSRSGANSDELVTVTSLAWAGALPAGVVIAALSAPIIDVVYGGKWMPAAPVLAALGLYGSLRVVFDVFAGYLYAQGRSRPVLWIQLLWLVILVAGMIFAANAYGIVGAAWVHVVVAVVVILPAYLIALRAAGVKVGALIKAGSWPTIATLPALAAALIARWLIPQPLLAMLVGGLASVLVYGLLMWSWGRQHLRQARTPERSPGART